jgi:hypothetical protein
VSALEDDVARRVLEEVDADLRPSEHNSRRRSARERARTFLPR